MIFQALKFVHLILPSSSLPLTSPTQDLEMSNHAYEKKKNRMHQLPLILISSFLRHAQIENGNKATSILMYFLTPIESMVSHLRDELLFTLLESCPASFIWWKSLHFGKKLSVFPVKMWALHFRAS